MYFAPTKMFVEDGPEPTDIAERTFLWVGGKLSSTHRVRDDVITCEHLFSDTDSVQYNTSSRVCFFFFYYGTKPFIMTQRGLRLHCNAPKHGQIPSLNTFVVWVLQPSYLLINNRPSIYVCVRFLRTKERNTPCRFVFPLSGNIDGVGSSVGL